MDSSSSHPALISATIALNLASVSGSKMSESHRPIAASSAIAVVE